MLIALIRETFGWLDDPGLGTDNESALEHYVPAIYVTLDTNLSLLLLFRVFLTMEPRSEWLISKYVTAAPYVWLKLVTCARYVTYAMHAVTYMSNVWL